MTSLIKLYDDDKKVLKIYFFSHINYSKRFSPLRSLPPLNGSDSNALSCFALISHITADEYHEAAVFRSIPNCVYVLEVIERWDEASKSREREPVEAIQWKITQRLVASSFCCFWSIVRSEHFVASTVAWVRVSLWSQQQAQKLFRMRITAAREIIPCSRNLLS